MNIRAKALETYKEQISLGMQNTPMNWHIWKRAFDIALKQSENVVLDGVSGSFSATDVERAYDDGYSTDGEVAFDIDNYR